MQQVANSSMGGAIAAAVARAIGAGRHGDASALVIHGVIISASSGCGDLRVQNLRKLQISAAIEKAQSKRAERVAATADPTTIAAEI